MREILFRGKRRANGKWVYWFYVEDDADQPFIFAESLTPGKGLFYVDPETVGQYTGTNDINGVKIFEGDIIDLSRGGFQAVFVVAWGGSCCGYGLKSKDNEYYCFIDHGLTTKCMRIIGNIYDNPELLT
jgi:uncharacterized phage protein (TIGR01671 family)